MALEFTVKEVRILIAAISARHKEISAFHNSGRGDAALSAMLHRERKRLNKLRPKLVLALQELQSKEKGD